MMRVIKKRMRDIDVEFVDVIYDDEIEREIMEILRECGGICRFTKLKKLLSRDGRNVGYKRLRRVLRKLRDEGLVGEVSVNKRLYYVLK